MVTLTGELVLARHVASPEYSAVSVWAPLVDPVAKMLDAVATMLDVVAKMLPAITFAAFAIYFMKSNLAAGLGAALRSSDLDRKSTRLNSSHVSESRMPSSA